MVNTWILELPDTDYDIIILFLVLRQLKMTVGNRNLKNELKGNHLL